jgi:tetratricopeptide (TPR) repeat protein
MMQRHQVGHGAREVNILCGHRKLGQADADQINLAFALTGVKEYEKALAVMDRCCKKWENSGVLACPFCNKQCRTYYLDSLEMIAVALISLDRLTEAFAVLTLCADLSKESERGRPAASVWLGLGQCCADLGLVEEAIQYHMRYVAIEDGPPAVGVIEELESLLDQRPSFYYGGAGHFLAQYWKKRGDDERSEKWKDRLYSLPDCTLGDVSNVFCDGEVLFKEGKFKLALRPFSLALRLHRTLGGFFCKGNTILLALDVACLL